MILGQRVWLRRETSEFSNRAPGICASSRTSLNWELRESCSERERHFGGGARAGPGQTHGGKQRRLLCPSFIPAGLVAWHKEPPKPFPPVAGDQPRSAGQLGCTGL